MFEIVMDQPALMVAIVFVGLFTFCVAIAQGMKQRSVKQEFVRKVRFAGTHGVDEESEIGQAEMGKASNSRLATAFASLGKRLSHGQEVDYSQAARIRFLRAGYRNANARSVFWGVKVFSTVFALAILLAGRMYLMQGTSYQVTMVIMVVGALFGFYLPDIYLRQKSDTRKEKILLALPDALDLMVICVEAGIGLDAAIQRVSQEIKFSSPELSDELNFTTLELRAGKERHDALRNLALRTNLSEINSLVTLLVQTDKFGTSMANALRVYSDTYRTERYQKAEELAAKLPVKLLFPLGVFIFPALFVVLLGPAAISIYKALIVK